MSNYLPLIVRDVLTKTGWTENELAVYSTLLEKGAMNLTDLSQETSIAISSLQYVLKKLGIKKMISKSMMNEKPLYAAANVEQLRKWTKGFCKQYLQFEDVVGKFIDQYDFNPQIYTPKVRFYEGVKGVKQSYRQMLRECDGGEIQAFFSVEESIQLELQAFFESDYIIERVSKGIKSKNIALRSPTGLKYKLNDEKYLSETRLVSKEYFPVQNTEINLFGDFMHCMSFNKDGAFAFIIKDKEQVSLLRSIFFMIWHTAEKIRFFEDIEGVKDSYRTILNDCKDSEIRSIFSVDNNEKSKLIKFFSEEYIPERIKKGLHLKNIGLESEESFYYKDQDASSNRETKLIPKGKFPSVDTEITLFDDFLHLMSLGSKPFAMLLKDKDLIAIFKSIFDMIWFTVEDLRFYDNLNDVKQSYLHFLNECYEGDEICTIYSVKEGVCPDLENFILKEYVPLRVEKNVKSKNVALENDVSKKYKKIWKKYLAETKLLSKIGDIDMNVEINLCRNFIHLMSSDGEKTQAFIIRNSSLFSLLMMVFKILWASSEKIKIYDGVEGIKRSYRDMLEECEDKEMVGFFSVVEGVNLDLQNFFINEYVPSRVKQKIKIKNISLDTPWVKTYKDRDKEDLRETIIVPQGAFPSVNSEINLYDDKIHCMSYEKEKCFAFIVTDKHMVAILRGLFGIAWSSLKNK